MTTVDLPAIGLVGTNRLQGNNSTNLSITSGEKDNYLVIYYYSSNSDTLTNEEIRDSIQIEKSSTASSYIPHAEQNAPLTLGNIEAYEGDEIQIDYVQKAGYKKVTGARLASIMGYYTFTGEENFTKSSNTNADKYTLSGTKIPNVIKDINIPTNRYTATIFCSHFKKAVSTTYDSNARVFYINSGPQLIFNFAEYGTTTVEDFKQFLAENQVKVAIKQNNPVTTEITDPTLLAQLETLINMKTYKNITNIESTGADLAPVLDCDYYQDMSTIKSRIFSYDSATQTLTITI